jgi:hypothetical protein
MKTIPFYRSFRVSVFLCLFLVVTVPDLAAQERQQDRALTLSEALELAEKKSETVGIATAELARAEGARRRARSAYFPQLSGSASYRRTVESQFSALESRSDRSSAPAPTCDRFVPRPGLPIEQRGSGLPGAPGSGSDRWRDHVDPADAAGDPYDLRNPGQLPGMDDG